MLRGEDHVLHPGVGGEFGPFVRVEEDRVERVRQTGIFGVRDAEVFLRPFADVLHPAALPFARGERVEAPVDHHAEFRTLEPFFVCHAGSFLKS